MQNRALLRVGLWITLFFSIASHASNVDSTEQRLIDANRTEAKYTSSNSVIHDTSLNDLLKILLDKLVAQTPEATPFNFRIGVMDNLLPYVYCLDNGAIFVSTGLIARLQNEEQLISLIALEMASVIRQDEMAKSDLLSKQGAAGRVIPNLFLIAATVGLAAIPIVDSQNKARNKLNNELQLASIRFAIQMLQKAKFDETQLLTGAQRLAETLSQEERAGNANLSSKNYLDTLNSDIQSVLMSDSLRKSSVVDNKAFRVFSYKYILKIAELDKQASRKHQFNAVITRIENEYEKNGKTRLLLAQFARQNMLGEENITDVINLYESSLVFPDVPVIAWKELAYLYRTSGNKEAAKKNFSLYLSKASNAIDAPIIRSYMENL